MEWPVILTIIGTATGLFAAILGVMIPLHIHLSNKMDAGYKSLNDKMDVGFKEVHQELYSINGRLSHIEGQLNPLKIVPFEKSKKKAKGE